MRIHLESRYRKFVRDLPQTILWCPGCGGHWRRKRTCTKCDGFGKLTKDSVQELVARVLVPRYRAKDSYFHGAGREDIDVRMLGRGRPFVFELEGVRELDVGLATLHEEINRRYAGRIEVDPFTQVPRARVPFWKEGRFAKIYRALVSAAAPLDVEPVRALAGRVFRIEQRTPQRVAHRRGDLAREREVTVLAVEPVDEQWWSLDLRCEHGTYVKEWVSGDEGRTKPSLPDVLGVPCRCAELDVLEILSDDTAPAAEALS